MINSDGKRANFKIYFWQISIIGFLISACGSSKTSNKNVNQITGFSSDYEPPEANYSAPSVADPSFKIHEPAYIEPYWTSALIMQNGNEVLDNLLRIDQNTFFFSFPIEKPTYIPISILGWKPANDQLMDASRQIFDALELVLNLEFKELSSVEGKNIIAISESIQTNTAGFSYFPNISYDLGSDIFISREYSNPFFLNNALTNYDYETLVHEIGHALGLKHPFESDGENEVVLDYVEDDTNHTAMSYDDYSHTFDGTFRTLDWMALTKLYGVNPVYESGDNTYKFNSIEGTFIIDGGGIDTIDCVASNSNFFIDLRQGAHSYEGSKSSYITAAGQLTISHSSEIENVKTGTGNNTVIGNELDNVIITSSGNDTIFAGNGADIVNPGMGDDIIDLSEDTFAQDLLILEASREAGDSNAVYGFRQGLLGDVIEIKNVNLYDFDVFPIVDVSNVPFGYLDNGLLRVFGDNLNNKTDLELSFNEQGTLQNLRLSEGAMALCMSSDSQETGAGQYLHALTNEKGYIEVSHIGHFFGNYLDIDNWTAENFLI